MAKFIEGKISGQGLKFALVVSRFNDFISDRLLQGALDALLRHGSKEADIHVVKVPGSFEIPMVARKLALGKKYHAVICLGAIIRGATSHFEYICSEVSKGVATVGLETGIPTIFGVITADTLEQAIERAGTKSGNKGWNAAMAAMEMANLIKQL